VAVLVAVVSGSAFAIWREVQASAVRGAALGGVSAYLWGLGWTVCLGLSILAWPVPRTEKPLLILLWSVKAAVGLGFMLFYESHYGALDAYGYYIRGTSPDFSWHGLQLVGGVDNIDTLVWAMHWIVPDSYHAMKMTFAFMGLVAVYLFYRAAVLAWPGTRIATLLLLALFPSILFWSTILGKDPVILLGLALLSLGAAQLLRGRRRWFVLFALGLLIVLLVRPWIGPMVVVPTILLAASRRWGGPTSGGRARWVVGCMGLLAFAGFVVSWLAESTPLIGDLLSRVNVVSRSWAKGGTGQTPPEFNSVWAVLAFLPLGIFTALFRPLLGEVPSAFGVLAGLESLALLGWVAFAALRTSRHRLAEPPVLWGILFIALWASVYAFLSYQNLGSGFRFRMQILPVGLLVLANLGGPDHGPSQADQSPEGESTRI
jgi:hypothetical protein